jgi:hypothetical protein
MHKEQKNTLLPMTLARESPTRERATSKTKQVDAKTEKQQAIKLNIPVMLATSSGLAEINDVCYALICKGALFCTNDIAKTLPPSITNLLKEYSDVFPTEIPLGLPPMRGIEHQIDLIPRASLPNRVAYRTNPEETKEI